MAQVTGNVQPAPPVPFMEQVTEDVQAAPPAPSTAQVTEDVQAAPPVPFMEQVTEDVQPAAPVPFMAQVTEDKQRFTRPASPFPIMAQGTDDIQQLAQPASPVSSMTQVKDDVQAAPPVSAMTQVKDDVQPAAPVPFMPRVTEDMQQFARGSAVDVLIVGAGPTGFMAAATLARYGISFRLIDKRPQQVFQGHAAGLQPRTAEIMHSLGFQHTLATSGHRFDETSFWLGTESGLRRSEKSPELGVIHPTPYPFVTSVHQGHTETMFSEDLASRGMSVDRPLEYIDHVNSGSGEYPLKAHLKNWISGLTEEVPVKYVLGCDGARSAVRNQVAVESSVHQTNDCWAVADVYAKTDFPDIRRRCNIRTEQGNVMLIPWVNNGNRVYTLLTKEEDEMLRQSKYDGVGEKRTNDQTVFGILTQRVKSVLKPYSFEIVKVEWISKYLVAQRISNSFAEEEDRVFILGDACHTHSPKAAQGMNVSMNDAYNLTWKLALTLRGIANPSLLKTYQMERQHIAKELIEFDERFAKLFASPQNPEGSEFHEVYVQSKGFVSGCGHRYPPGLLTDEHVDVGIAQDAAEPLTPGKRLLPVQLRRHFDGVPVSSLDDMPSNGHFRIIVFAGSRLQSGGLDKVATYLAGTDSPLNRNRILVESSGSSPECRISKAKDFNFNLADDPGTVIDLFLIHTSSRWKVPIEELPKPFAEWQATIYEDVNHQAHSELGVDVDVGALAVVRPDGYVGLVTGLDGGERIGKYFEEVMVEREMTNGIPHQPYWADEWVAV